MGVDDAPLLQGDRVRLRAASDEDIRTRASLGKVPEIVRSFGGLLEEEQPMSTEEAAAMLQWRFGAGPHWVIADEGDRFIGTVRLAPLDRHNRSARFGIGIFDPARLGQGLGTEATMLALEHGFGALGLHRISLTVLAGNHRAVASYRKCGFVVEGRLHQTLRRDGAWEDDLTMAVLAPDWDQRDPPGREHSPSDVLRRMVAMFDSGDPATADEVVSPNYIDHQGLAGRPIRGAEGFADVVRASRSGHDELHVTIEDLVEEGDRAVARIAWRGRRSDGHDTVRETIDIVRVRGGMAVEHWGAGS